MKKYIKKLLREGLLTERLMELNEDIEFIYNTYYKDIYETIARTGTLEGINFKEAYLSTYDLKSSLSKKADKLNPCTIQINVSNGNNYIPKLNIINITYPYNAYNYLRKNGYDIERAAETLNVSQGKSLRREFHPEVIKGSIHHELVHWVDDTLHNNHIKNSINTANEKGHRLDNKGEDINSSKMEIQSQIHNIVQLKHKYKNVWDRMSFEEMISKSPTLMSTNVRLKGDVNKKWKRDILTRMYREGLLGKKMYN